ncbi:MAG TPA: hypothetical protein VME69_06700 [Methylocella sp.]|nr:hypothetical protein [Methylocella sp.]
MQIMIDGRGLGALTPLSEALQALIVHCAKTTPVEAEIERAAERVLAEPVHAPTAIPPFPIALSEGWAVAAQDTFGASSYTPVFANKPPRVVMSGSPMPGDTDAVLPLPNINTNAFPIEILSPASPGEGVRATGSDFAAGQEMVAAGTKLRFDHIAFFRLANISKVRLRIPQVAIVSCGDFELTVGVKAWLATLITAEGGQCCLHARDPAGWNNLADAIEHEVPDLIILLGAFGSGELFAKTMESTGEVIASRLAVRPGEAIGCGVLHLQSRKKFIPLVSIPGRFEDALAAWLLLTCPCLHRLSGATRANRGEALPLARKIVSSPGMSDLVLLRSSNGTEGGRMWHVLAAGDIAWAAIADADAWLVVPPDCEGYAAGQNVFALYF